MEQTPSLPGRSPELPSVSPISNGEIGRTISNPEVSTGSSSERQERSSVAPAAEQVSATPTLVQPPITPTTLPIADDTSADPIVSSPTVANDDDLIEKEWVEKAKKVLVETKDDPYRREQEVNRLQADYLFKRYGRELGSLSDN